MYRRIMVAIDNDFATGKTLPTAIELARLTGARLALCHALDQTMLAQREGESFLPKSVDQLESGMRAAATAFLEEAAALARSAGLDVDIRLAESEYQHVAELLAEAATEWQADLLVVGVREHPGVERFFASRIGERLAKKVSTGLLLVRNDGS